MKARKIGAVALAALVLVSFAFPSHSQSCGTTVPPGPVVPGTTWKLNGSPYCITGNIQVNMLTIQAGVQVLVNGPYRIDVQTTIQCQGTQSSPVLFSAYSAGVPWSGLSFTSTPNGSSFTHTIIEKTNGSAITLSNCASPSFTNCTFRDNAATGSGGGINAVGVTENLLVTDCLFINNTSSGHGGALRGQMSPGYALVCTGTTFVDNTCNVGSAAGTWAGGGILLDGGDADITDCRFIDNAALGNGGGIGVMGPAAALNISDCEFNGNTATGQGGGVDAAGIMGALDVADCDFIGNTSTWHGGALRVQMSPGYTFTCDGTTFFGNICNPGYVTGNPAGGAIHLQEGDAILTSCLFDTNRANARCTSSGCTVVARGGGFFVANGSGMATVENTVFVRNITDARNDGSCFMAGTSDSRGSNVHVDSGDLTLRNCILSCGNAAVSGNACGPVKRGEGLFVYNGTVLVEQSAIARNAGATGLHQYAGSLNVKNSIVFFNNGSNAQIGGTVTATYSDIENGFAGVGNISFNPVFAGLGCNCGDLTIQFGSPCMDSGDPALPADGCFPPSWSTSAPDMGAHGGPLGCNWASGLTTTPPSMTLISVSKGGTQTFNIAPGSGYALDTYVLLGSFNGFAPGFEFGGFCIPLNIDTYFNLSVGSPAQTTLSNSIGKLDGGGSGQALFDLPAGLYPTLVGLHLYHAAIILHVTPTLLEVAHVTNPVSIEFTP